MKSFYLYRLCVTGMTSWHYVESNNLDAVNIKSKPLMSQMSIPNLPLFIESAIYGTIKSEFDYEQTIIPGLMRYGITDDDSDIFKLKWMNDYYSLDINGYDSIQIFGKDIVVFICNDIVIAKMKPVFDLNISYEFNEADWVQYFEIDEKFIPVMEILGAFINLRFTF